MAKEILSYSIAQQLSPRAIKITSRVGLQKEPLAVTSFDPVPTVRAAKAGVNNRGKRNKDQKSSILHPKILESKQNGMTRTILRITQLMKKISKQYNEIF